MRREMVLGIAFLCGCSSATAQELRYQTVVRAIVDDVVIEQYVMDDPELKESLAVAATGSAVARAQIAPGINRAYAHWDSLDPQQPAQRLIADAWTHWTDEITISDPQLDGTVGTFTASLRVFGTADFLASGAYASGDADIYGFWDSWIGTSTDGGSSFLVGGWFGSWFSEIDGTIYYDGDDLNQPLTDVELEFIYGRPFLLRTNMEAYFDADNENRSAGTIDGTLDFSHTAYWNGISGFFDAQGNPVVPESFASQSGVDWRLAVTPLAGDFNGDARLDCADINALVAAIAGGSTAPTWDLTGDGTLDLADLDQWRAFAGAANLPSGNSIPVADANLDGQVDGSDFGAWNSHQFTPTAAWCSGDFNADGAVDGSDFSLWNGHKFTSADGQSLVPELTMPWGWVGALALGARLRRRHRARRADPICGGVFNELRRLEPRPTQGSKFGSGWRVPSRTGSWF